jgi:hypothetical protein
MFSVGYGPARIEQVKPTNVEGEYTMKKWFKVVGSLVGAALLAALVAGVVFAQGPVEDSDGVQDLVGQGRGNGYGFVDEDGDGVNDRYGTHPEFVDEDGDGLCDIHGVAPGEGTEQGYGRRFRTDDNAQGTPMAGRGGFGRRAAGN